MKRSTVSIALVSVIILSVAASLTSQPPIIAKNGVAALSSKRYNIQIVLTDDPAAAVAEWNNPGAHGVPGFSAVKELQRGVRTAPLVLINVVGGAYASVRYDAFLERPDGKLSANKGENLVVIEGESDGTQIFLARQIWGWTLDESDKSGSYAIIVRIHDDKGYRQEVRFPLELDDSSRNKDGND